MYTPKCCGIQCVLRWYQVHVTKTDNTVKFSICFMLQGHRDMHLTVTIPFSESILLCFISSQRNKNYSNISLTFHEQILGIVQHSLVCKLQVLPVSQRTLPMGAHTSCSCDQIQQAMPCLNVTHSCSHKTKQACTSHT
jgi:hypothetical protein